MRKNELSRMNLLLCMLVIFIHVSSYPVDVYRHDNPLYVLTLFAYRMSGFAVQGFIFLAGLRFTISCSRDSFTLRKYYAGRFFRVIVPYLIAVAVYYAYFIVRFHLPGNWRELFHHMISGDLASHFYFVILLIQFILAAPVWVWLVRWADSPFRCFLVLFGAFFLGSVFGGFYLEQLVEILFSGFEYEYSDRTFTTYLIYWVLGLVAGAHYEKTKDALVKHIRPLLCLWLSSAATECALSWIHYTGTADIASWLNYAHMFYSLCSILFFFSLAIRITQHRPALSAAARVMDHASYQIYLWHIIPLYEAEIFAERTGMNYITGIFLVRIIFTYGITLLVCMSLTWLVRTLRHQPL